MWQNGYSSLFRQFKGFVNKTNTEVYIFWVTLLGYGLTFTHVNNKTIYVIIGIIWVLFWIKLRDVRYSLFFVYVMSYLFMRGKTYQVEMIPAYLMLPGMDYDRTVVSLIVKPVEVLSLLMAFFLLRDWIIQKKWKICINKYVYVYALYLVLMLIATVLGSEMPKVSFFILFQNFGLLIFLIYFFVYAYPQKKNLKFLIYQLAALVIMEILLILGQYFFKGLLGVYMESIEKLPLFGFGSDEDGSVFRPVGSFGHANIAANFFVLSLPLFVSYLYKNFNKLIIFLSFMLGLIGLVLVNSRSAWISFVISMIMFWYIAWKKWKLKFKVSRQIKRNILFFWMVLLLVGLVVFPSRIVNSINFFDKNGGYSYRDNLIKKSMVVISKNPVWGTGLGTNSRVMFLLDSTEAYALNFDPVHNVFLLHIAEVGLIAFACWLIFVWLLIRKVVFAFNKKNLYLLGGFCSLIGVIMNLQFHTFVDNLGFPLLFISFFILSEQNLNDEKKKI